MRIVIIGAGASGQNLAEMLCSMHHDVVLIDRRQQALDHVSAELDILTIEGEGSSPATLDQAEIAKADLVVAVTNTDEVNILACMYARKKGAKHTVARIADQNLISEDSFDLQDLGLDAAISHKEACATEVFDVLHMPGVMEVTPLFNGGIMAISVNMPSNSPLLDTPLKQFSAEPWFMKVRFIGLVRDQKLQIPHGNTTLREKDDVYLVLQPEHAEPFLDWLFANQRAHFEKVIVAGCGDLGLSLATRLETTSLETVLIESDRNRAEFCSEILDHSLVIHGNASDRSTLKETGIRSNTAFVATTGDDELNILSCVLARQLGASFTIAQINKAEYVPIIDNLGLLDRVVSPHLSMIKAILRFVRGKNVQDVALFHKLPGELLEVSLGNKSSLCGQQVRDLELPKGAIVAAVQRDAQCFVPTGDLTLLENDHLVLYCLPSVIDKLQSLFQK